MVSPICAVAPSRSARVSLWRSRIPTSAVRWRSRRAPGLCEDLLVGWEALDAGVPCIGILLDWRPPQHIGNVHAIVWPYGRRASDGNAAVAPAMPEYPAALHA